MNQGQGKILVLHTMIKGVEDKKDFWAVDEDVDIIGLSQEVDVIHNREDRALVGTECIHKAKEAEKAGYQAIVLTCHGDPNLYDLRDAVRIPVIGTMEAAMHFCAMLAHRFSILVPELAVKRWQEENAIKYGFESRVASVRVVPWKAPLEEVLELSRRKPIPSEVIEPTLSECIKAIEEDDAAAITFGCGCAKWMTGELSEQLRSKGYEVPVVNPSRLSVDVARVLIKQGLTHSLSSYPGTRIR